MSYRRLLENANYLLALVEMLASSGIRGTNLTAQEDRRVSEIGEDLKEARLAIEARRYAPECLSVVS
jgi:hypothetical protein